MSTLAAPAGAAPESVPPPDPSVLARARELFAKSLYSVHTRTDKTFAWLMLVQWLGGIVAAVWIAPRTWVGASSALHLHVPVAVILGGVIAALPVAMTFLRPGTVSTRQVVATAQMLMSALLIHLSGGRIETHFHVFVSLAFLALYLDWRVLATGTVVVAADHLLRGIYWPESAYGVASASPWRAAEHASWVLFEVSVLVLSIRFKLRDMALAAERLAELEASRTAVEEQVRERTRELAASVERFRLLAASSPIGIFETDRAGACQYTNARLQQLSGLSEEESLGESWTRLVHPEDLDKLQAARGDSIREEDSLHHVFRLLPERGDQVWVSARAAPLRDAAGQVTGYVGTVEDITPNKRAEAELIRAREAALENLRLKSEFLANMSHEIRTPMNGIIGMTELTLETDLDHEQREYLTAARESAEGLLGVINDILDFSKIEAGKMRMEAVTFALRDTLKSTVRMLAVKARQKNLTLSMDMPPDVPSHVVGDPGRLRQVLLNLLGNAVKFTDAGAVTLHVRCVAGTAATSGDIAQIEFAVTDSGIGIPLEKQTLIFDAFTQADGSTTRRFGGTGLGLAISSQLVGLMGGSLSVDSKDGAGSTFRFAVQFELPSELEHATVTDEATPRAKPLPQTVALQRPGPVAPEHALHVLLAEDNPVNRLLAERILQIRGHRVTSVVDGTEVMAHLELGVYDLLLLDLSMPKMDGFETAAAIRASEQGTGRHLPIVALSAHAMAGVLERCLAAGMDAYSSKPFKPAELMAAIRTAIGRPGAGAPSPSAAA